MRKLLSTLALLGGLATTSGCTALVYEATKPSDQEIAAMEGKSCAELKSMMAAQDRKAEQAGYLQMLPAAVGVSAGPSPARAYARKGCYQEAGK